MQNYDCIKATLSNETFQSNKNALYRCSLTEQSLTTHKHQALDMWLMWLKKLYFKFYLILINFKFK